MLRKDEKTDGDLFDLWKKSGTQVWWWDLTEGLRF